jgi:hypothetical protein
MRFDELPLNVAVFQVFESVYQPGSDEWLSCRANEARGRVVELLLEDPARSVIPTVLEVVAIWRGLRKAPESHRLKCAVAKRYGQYRCFYAGRGLGDCSDEVDLDQIIPAARGGRYTVENCLIVCSRHNRGRGCATIEDYLFLGTVCESIEKTTS